MRATKSMLEEENKELKLELDTSFTANKLLEQKIYWLETHSQVGQQSTMTIALEKVTEALAQAIIYSRK